MQDDIFNAALLAEAAFLFVAAVSVDDENVRLQRIDCRDEIHHSATGVDERVLDVLDGLHHEEALLFGVERLVVLVVEHRLIGADPHVEVAVLRCLAEKLDMSAVQQVIAT